jgi:hypothetical protein
VALEWDGKGQGTQWPNMAVEVDSGCEREGTLGLGPGCGREGGSKGTHSTESTVYSLQFTVQARVLSLN